MFNIKWFPNIELQCQNQLKNNLNSRIPLFMVFFVLFFFLRQISQCSHPLRLHLVVIIRMSLILFCNLLAFLQLLKVLLADSAFSEIMIRIGVRPAKILSHVSSCLSAHIPSNYSSFFFSFACVSVHLLWLAITQAPTPFEADFSFFFFPFFSSFPQ